MLYEAPGRVAGTLSDLVVACGESRQVAVARELTKLHEETWRGSLAEAARWARSQPVRGEVVIVLAGADPVEIPTVSDAVLTSALAERLEQRGTHPGGGRRHRRRIRGSPQEGLLPGPGRQERLLRRPVRAGAGAGMRGAGASGTAGYGAGRRSSQRSSARARCT